MDEKSKQEIEEELEPRQGSGSMLAAARKQQSKTVEEIATELNLSVSQIKTIELDQTDGLPEPTYVRGYIRSYAKLLGLDSEQVLNNYLNPNWQQSTNLDDMPRGIANADDLSDRRGFSTVKVVSLLLVAAVAGFLWYSGFFEELISGSNSVQSVSQSEPVENVSSANNNADVSNSGSADALNPLAAADSIAVGPEVASTANELVLDFTQTSWVDIRDQEDTRLAYKSYAEGEDLRVSSDGPMSVFIGNAEGVSVTLNGQPFDITQHREGVYAKFSIGDQQ